MFSVPFTCKMLCKIMNNSWNILFTLLKITSDGLWTCLTFSLYRRKSKLPQKQRYEVLIVGKINTYSGCVVFSPPVLCVSLFFGRTNSHADVFNNSLSMEIFYLRSLALLVIWIFRDWWNLKQFIGSLQHSNVFPCTHMHSYASGL